MIYDHIDGVPDFSYEELDQRDSKYCVLIPVINEGERIKRELETAKASDIGAKCDIILCDGGSTDGSTDIERLRALNVNTLLVKTGPGRQGAQLRMGLWWAVQRGYEGFITIDGNDKDSIEDIPRFICKLDEGYDFIQGSRFIKGGEAIRTPLLRLLSVRLLHAPVISLTAGEQFTDTTNAFRAHSRKYITHPDVQPFRDIFVSYELLAYLSVRASQLGLKTCEVPVRRAYPKAGKAPTKISFFKGNSELLRILFANAKGKYAP